MFDTLKISCIFGICVLIILTLYYYTISEQPINDKQCVKPQQQVKQQTNQQGKQQTQQQTKQQQIQQATPILKDGDEFNYDGNLIDQQMILDVFNDNSDQYVQMYQRNAISDDFLQYLYQYTDRTVQNYQIQPKHIQKSQNFKNILKREQELQTYWNTILKQSDQSNAARQKDKVQEIKDSIQCKKSKIDTQNVHQSTLIQSANQVLRQSKQQSQDTPILQQVSIEDIILFIQSQQTDESQKQDAIHTVQHIYRQNIHIDTANEDETFVLSKTYQEVIQKQPKYNELFIQYLSEMCKQNKIVVCPVGRYLRLCDLIAIVNESNLIPEFTLNEMVFQQMQKICEETEIKEERVYKLTKYLNEDFKHKDLLTSKDINKYISDIEQI